MFLFQGVIFESANGKSADTKGPGPSGCSSSTPGTSRQSGRGAGNSRDALKRGFGTEQDGSGDDPDRPNSFKKKKLEISPDLDDDDDKEEDEEESDAEDQAASSNPGTPVAADLVGAPDLNQPVLAAAQPVPVAGPINPNHGNQAAYVEGKKDWLSYKDLMSTTYPVKSRNCYLSAYLTLKKYMKKQGVFHPDSAPEELTLMNFFHHLRRDKKWAPTTLWSYFSRVNAVMKHTWGVNLTIYPSLTNLLKAYESGHKVKKASVFTPQQVN